MFADNVLLQRVGDQFYLTFGQVRLPAIQGPVKRGVAEIRPMVRVIIPKDALERIADLLTRSLQAGK